MHMEQDTHTDTQMLVNMIMGLNPLEFRHLFGIYNVDSFHRMGVQICAHCTRTRGRERLSSHLSPAFHTRPRSMATTTTAAVATAAALATAISGNYTCRHFHTRAFFFTFFWALKISLSSSVCVLCVHCIACALCLPAVSSVLYAQSIQALRSSRVESRCLVSILVCQISMCVRKICMHAQLSNRL